MAGCLFPLALALISSLILNTAMVVLIWRKARFRPSSELLLGHIALTNTVFAISLMINGHSMNEFHSRPSVVEYTVVSISLSMSFVQLCANIALAYDRYYAVACPLKYRQRALAKVWIKALFIGDFVCFSLGSGCGYLIVRFELPAVKSYLALISRASTIAILAFLYHKMHRKFTAKRVACSSSAQKNSKRTENNAVAVRPTREKRLMEICVGITASFAFFNLPYTVFNAVFHAELNCNGTQGKVLISLLFVLILNLTFDPLWYFYFYIKRHRTNRSM